MIPKNRLYKRVGKGNYVINIPVAFSRKDVRSKNWNRVQDDIAMNVANLLVNAFETVEQDVRNKK